MLKARARARKNAHARTKIIKIMCLYPKFVRNPKYLPNKKNGGYAPILKDRRVMYVPVGCGKCIECRRQKAHEWQTRLHQELRTGLKAYFITLTFSEESLQTIENKLKVGECNAVAGHAVRLFLERWRKRHKKTLRHWLITELGHNGTERIHLHGLIFTNNAFNNDILQEFWQYGMTYTGDYCNEKTINYVVKYVTKIDTDHKGFEGQIFCSAGIGQAWCNTQEFDARKFNGKDTIEYITLPNGLRMNMPIYYRNKRYTEEEREKLWLQKIDKGEIFVTGIKCKVKTAEDMKKYMELLEAKQKENTALGFGDDSDIWKKKEYNTTLRKLNIAKSTKKAEKHNVN